MFRQGDPVFQQLLMAVREDKMTPAVLSQLHALTRPLPASIILPTRLYCTNRDVDRMNAEALAGIKEEGRVFVKNDLNAEAAQIFNNVPEKIELRVGAQVMLTKKSDCQLGERKPGHSRKLR